MTSTTLHPSKVPANRLAVGYRWEDERWKEEPALPHGSFGAMGGMLTSIRDLSRYVSVLLDAWPPRDGPETRPIRRASLREMQQPWRPSGMRVVLDKSTSATQLTVRQLRVRSERDADVPVPRDGRPRRRAARVRVAHAVAPRLRRRHHRVRQCHLHRLESRRRGGDRSPGQDGRSAASRGASFACARRGARRRLEAGHALGRPARGEDRRREPVSGPFEGSAPQGDRGSAGEGRRLLARPTSSTSSKTRCAGNGR